MFTSLLRWLRSGSRRPARPRRSFVPRLEVLEDRAVPAFLAPVGYPVGKYVEAVAIGDFNNDGKPDLVSASKGQQNGQIRPVVEVLLGRGDGTFANAQTTKVAKTPTALAAADLNADGKLDVVTTNTDRTLTVLLGRGNGAFQTARSFSLPSGHIGHSLVVGHFDSDGKPDVAVTAGRLVAGELSFHVDILRGDGQGSLTNGNSYRLPGDFYFTGDDTLTSSTGTAAGDFNGDGRTDLVATARFISTPGNVFVLLGQGNGAFTAPAPLGVVSGRAVAVGDMTNDGKLDIVTSAGVCVGNGNGTFQLRPSDPVLGLALTLADLNRDGKLDVLGTWGFSLGNGDGYLQEFLPYGPSFTTYQPRGVATSDLDGDGWADVVVGNQSALTVRRNNRVW